MDETQWDWLEQMDTADSRALYDLQDIVRGGDPEKPNILAATCVKLAYLAGIRAILRELHTKGIAEGVINRYGYVIREGKMIEAGKALLTRSELNNIQAVNGREEVRDASSN